MSTVDIRSMAATVIRRALLAGATVAFVASRGASAAEPPVTVEYESAFAEYRHFDAQALAVEWRQANDAIRDGAQDASHGMRDMQAPMAAPPTTGDELSPATPDEHRAHRQ